MNLSGRTINNRYRLHERVRRDSLGEAYRAADLREGGDVTFTVFNSGAASRRTEDIIRFKSDVKKLQDLPNGNCAAPRETGSLFDYSYLVSEPCEGPSLAELFISGERHTCEKILAFALDMARGLAFVHGCGIPVLELHPESVIITGNGAKIINAGAAHLRDYGAEHDRAGILERIEYLSPEQSGMVNRPADERSDLFSLGTLLYRMVTGSSPYRGDDICATLFRVIAGTPDFESAPESGAPPVFIDIIRKLMEKEPDRRYQGAQGLIRDLEALRGGDTDFIPGRGDDGFRPHFHSGIVGRDGETGRMKSLYDGAVKGEGALCLVTGEAGAGKTRLVEELLNHVYSSGGFALYGKCNEGYESAPYGAAGELMGSFMQTYHSLSDEERSAAGDHFRRAFPGPGSRLAKLNPLLGEIFTGDDLPAQADEKSESVRFQEMASGFFLAASEIRRGLAVAVDDVQWSDEGTLAITGELLENIAQRPILILLSSREESPAGRERLDSFRERARERGVRFMDIHAAPLDSGETALLVMNMLHGEDRDMAAPSDFIFNRARGNAFHSISLLRRLVADDILIRTGGRWIFDEGAAGRIDVSDSLLETVFSRVRLLDDEEARLLSCAAAVGREFSLSLLFSLSSLDGDSVVSVIDRALGLQILKPFPAERNSYVFFHDRIKEILYERIPPEERRSLHRAIAQSLENAGTGDVPYYDLARHYLLAGIDEKFLDWALPAAKRARDNFAYEDAETTLVRVLELIRSPEDPRRVTAKRELGGIHLITGNFRGAVESFNELLPLMKDPGERAGLLALKSEAHYRLNEWDECVRAAHGGLRLLGESFPGSLPAIALRSIKEFAIFSVNLLRRGTGKAGKAAKTSDMGIIALYRVLIQNYMFRNLGPEFVYSSLRMAVISQSRIGPSKELSISLIGVGLIFAALAFFRTALNLLDRALRMSLDAGDRWCEAYSYGFKGLIGEFMGDYRAGIDRYYGLSMDTFTEIGDIKNIGVIHIGLAQSYYFLSGYDRALEHNGESYRIARKINDAYFTGMALVYYARLHREKGDLEEAARYGAEALDYNHDRALWQNYCAALIELGCLSLENRDPGGAVEHLEKARRHHEEGYFSPQHTVHVYAHLAEALIAHYALRERSLSRRERKKIEARIRRMCRKALRNGRRWVSHLGKAWRARGALNVMLGKSRKAGRCYLKSIERCGALGNRYDLARAYYDYGLFLMQERRAAESRDCIEAAYAIFREIGARSYAGASGRLLGIGSGGDRDSISSLISRERETALREISRSLTGGGATSQDLRRIVERIFEYSGAGSGCLFAREPAGMGLRPIFSKPGDDPGMISALRRGAEKALDAKKQDTGDNYRQADRDGAPQEATEAVYLVLGTGNETYGVCCLVEPHFIGSIHEDDMAVIRDILSHSLLLMARPGGISTEVAIGGDDISSLSDSAVEKIEKALHYIGDNYRSDISRDGLAAHVGISPNYFGKLFRDYTGQKMNEYITGLRITEATRLLRESNDMITDIAFAVGFDNLRTFNRAFQKIARMTPQKYREKIK